MFSFKQVMYIVDIKYINGDLDYTIDFYSGERSENKDFNKIRTINLDIQNTNDILTFDKAYLSKIEKFFNHMYLRFKKINIDFSAFIKLHNERIIIDNYLEDFRKYGFCKIVLKDSLNNIYTDDIPITTSNPSYLEDEILKHINDDINYINSIQNTKSKIEFENIPVIFSSRAAGYFIHEILGHSLENDFFSYNKETFSNLEISSKLTVIDSIEGYENIVGLNKYDDMGTLIKPLNLIEKGKLKNIISTETTESFDEKLYGFSRRESYKTSILPRMRCTFIKSFDDMNENGIISKYKNAIFLDKTYLGGVNPQNNNYFVRGQGFLVKNGEKTNLINNLNLKGNIVKDLKSFDYIGNDFKIYGNFCSKLEQTVRVGVGGPTISLRDMSIEGDIYGTY